MRALSLLPSFLALWAGTAMLLSRLPWFRDSLSLAERLAPYVPNVGAALRSRTADILVIHVNTQRRALPARPARMGVNGAHLLPPDDWAICAG